MSEFPWKKIRSSVVYDNPWITLTEDDVINPGGKESIYGKVSFKNLAIGIIPLDDDNNTWLVGQHRYTLGEHSWEIPMGGGPLKIDKLESAKRELEEETGLIAQEWQEILKLHTSNSVTDEIGYVFIATQLSQGKMVLEETEQDLEVKKLPLSEAVAWVESGKITDALSVAGILAAARLLNL